MPLFFKYAYQDESLSSGTIYIYASSKEEADSDYFEEFGVEPKKFIGRWEW